jgi:hypothetical protein
MSADSQYEHEFLPPNTGWQHRGNGGVYAPIDASSNKALPWIVFSWFLSGGAIIGLLIWSILAPSLIDSRVEGRVAKAEAMAELARKEASVAKDIVDLEVQRRKAREEIKR